ncbi:MAG: hypothetical protein EPO28_18385 [Saprospiraceae bacterium]|nr:MAG: hypothetical protein EPO28_18385 [Saprospiraceae bacterium]
MDIQLEKIKIMRRLAEVEEEWILKSIKKLLGIEDVESDDEFVRAYEANLKPMTKEELIRRSEKALEDFKEGRFVELEEYIQSLER